MRPFLITAAIAIAATLAGFASSSASAARPLGVSIDLFPATFCCPEVGTWKASGAINDSGTYVKTAGPPAASIPRDTFCRPEHTGAFREEFLLTGSQGTLTVKEEELLVPTGEFCPPSTGVWQIEAGTDAYSRVSGHGVSQFLKAPVFDLSLIGVLSKADL